jgi:hypothetical protein
VGARGQRVTDCVRVRPGHVCTCACDWSVVGNERSTVHKLKMGNGSESAAAGTDGEESSSRTLVSFREGWGGGEPDAGWVAWWGSRDSRERSGRASFTELPGRGTVGMRLDPSSSVPGSVARQVGSSNRDAQGVQ